MSCQGDALMFNRCMYICQTSHQEVREIRWPPLTAKGHLLACLTYSYSTAKTVNYTLQALVNQAAQLTSAVVVKAMAGSDGAAAGAALPGSPLEKGHVSTMYTSTL